MNRRLTDVPGEMKEKDEALRMADLADAMGVCGGVDPGPDYTDDPDPYPPEPNGSL